MKKICLALATALCLAIGSAWAAASVNINTASAEQLQQVHGIGEKTAALIISYRDEHGPFKSVDELIKVRGIGKKSLERFRDQLDVED